MVEYDRYKRYVLPDPVTGEERAWTRVTTLKSTLTDKYGLYEWEKRMVVLGLSRRPDLVNMAGTLSDPREDKSELNKIAWQAKEAAGGSVAANEGTALHNWFQMVDDGKSTAHASRTVKVALDEYRSLLLRKRLEVEPEYSERIVCVPSLGLCGRVDRMGLHQGIRRILDIKSQQSMEWNHHELAIQLACYANAEFMWNEVTDEWEEMPETAKDMGVILWLPSGTKHAEAIPVNLTEGWKLAQLSHDVREMRKNKTLLGAELPDDPAVFLERIQASTDPEEIRNIGRLLLKQKQFTPEIKAAGIARINELESK